MAKVKNRKGHYRAAHYVKPSSASSRWKKPSLGLLLGAAVLAIAAWNTLFPDSPDDSVKTPQPSGVSASAVPGH
ncbi:hypothetical protein [Streptomyces sp. SID12488]|uniref:hypothetical protein n=1 Tax=Streptomyces sp. SID12488 TaxID=2706040 RepID=UPI0013DD2E02|nr:hypothetical protein [Streptomyces sp. SID12488]NEA68633.1 hypothetical protein [Streptomyces sp. SID12488]